ncbi:hypothetical protein CYANOKiyG1_59240 [Okeania sp. KiyG1]|nr:hypothetical protein CYANOKiyG1_59240 [Okeania sp. KiyG1]
MFKFALFAIFNAASISDTSPNEEVTTSNFGAEVRKYIHFSLRVSNPDNYLLNLGNSTNINVNSRTIIK